MRRFGYTEALAMILAALWLLALALCFSGCVLDVRVSHQLKSPIKCELAKGKIPLSFRCAHEKPEPEMNPPPGDRVPPL